MSRPELILIDTCFLFAWLSKKDEHHKQALELGEFLDMCPIILPWPVIYETANTALARKPNLILQFLDFAHSENCTMLDDSSYRQESLKIISPSSRQRNTLSLVDAVLCKIIEDVNVQVTDLFTFNKRDFFTVCACNGVNIHFEN